MFEMTEKRFDYNEYLHYSHYCIVDGERKILEVQIPEPKTDFAKDIFKKYQSSIGELMKKICLAINKNESVKEFSRNYEDFIYTMVGSSAYICYEDGVGQFGYANTGSPETTEKFVQNFLSLLVEGKQLFDWNECYMVV